MIEFGLDLVCLVLALVWLALGCLCWCLMMFWIVGMLDFWLALILMLWFDATGCFWWGFYAVVCVCGWVSGLVWLVWVVSAFCLGLVFVLLSLLLVGSSFVCWLLVFGVVYFEVYGFGVNYFELNG